MSAFGSKIIEGLRVALAGDIARVTIEGQTWVRRNDWDELMEDRRRLHRVLAAVGDDPRVLAALETPSP